MPTNTTSIDSSYHHFRLFSYLSVTVLSVSIMVGLFLVLQHLDEEDQTSKNLANQKTLLENQNFLKKILEENEEHEQNELDKMDFLLYLFNTTGSNVTQHNSEKLDILIAKLDNLTKTVNDTMF